MQQVGTAQQAITALPSVHDSAMRQGTACICCWQCTSCPSVLSCFTCSRSAPGCPRWGYHDLEEVAGVVEGYQGAGIPLDTIWTDIDYMSQYRDFTFDPVNFDPQRFRAFVDRWACCKKVF